MFYCDCWLNCVFVVCVAFGWPSWAHAAPHAFHDELLCHGVRAHHWLVNQGYKCLLTDMSAPTEGSLLTDQGLPPRERQSLEVAPKWFYQVWMGDKTILDLFMELGGTHVIMLCPERSQHHLTCAAPFLQELGPTLLCPEAEAGTNDWTFGHPPQCSQVPCGPGWQ